MKEKQNKTDYSALSDFEVNCLVAERLGVKIPKNWENNNWIEKSGDELFLVDGGGCKYTKCYVKDYCKNPADIMPIAVEHKISLYSENESLWRAYFAYTYALNSNPYRAIAICFLKMQEAEA